MTSPGRRSRVALVTALVASTVVAVVLAGVILLAAADQPQRGSATALASSTPAAPVVAVDDAELVDRRTGERLALLGANWPGFEYACIQGRGHNDGGDVDAAISAMTEWGMTAVRIPLNQDCWFDDRPAIAFGTGAEYRASVRDWVDRLSAAGLVVLLDLHWSAPAGTPADGLRPMPDARSISFWSSVATEFRKHRGVVLDLFNEPHSRYDDAAGQWALELDWACWAEGGCDAPLENDRSAQLSGSTYAAVGMDALVDAVRAAGARQPLILSGLDYANDLRGWLDAAPDDDQLIAGVHPYPDQRCADAACWEAELGPLADRVPVLVAEFGQSDGGDAHVRDVYSWASTNTAGALAWAWWDIADATSPDARFALVEGPQFSPRAPSGTALRELLGEQR
ncbi:MAG: glycoside hydrolase family 5 protein [Actinobacteria bacterium]|nr:glycoside hydrolase family 5 protein [Actinomycetota bacterium]MBU1610059.1 glycoside hydrolase family 5 protein [Actinomycetota bacterium]MBU2315573.1 glycoside hydrolase family 5 protein [Actinomycetota bacterium]MBU2385373.1 glycoside hydrolase family 5 protein [Actinomycetota bacterium]